MTVDDLLAIEEIRQLRLAYSAHLDAQNLDELVNIFSEDCYCDFGGDYAGVWNGREEIRAGYAKWMPLMGEAFDAIHVVTNPMVRLLGLEDAKGQCYLIDLLTRQKPHTALETRGGHDNPLIWLGIYEDRYRKIAGEWKIAQVKLHYLWPERKFTGLQREKGWRR